MNRLTDKQEIWNYFELVQKHPRNISRNLRKMAYPEMDIPNVNLILVKKELKKRLTDIQEIWNYLEVVYKHPKNVSRRFEKDRSSKTGDVQWWSIFSEEMRQWNVFRKYEKDSSSKTGYHNFTKEVRQWTDRQTYKKS